MPSSLLSSSTKRWTLAVVCAATAMLMLDIAVVNTALSRIAADLHTGLGGLQWIVDAYTLALATTVLTAGGLADRLGRRRVFAVGLGVFTLASIACAASTDITFLDAARAVQGIGAATMFAVSLALLAHAFPGEKERAGALAAYGATIGGTFAIAPLVGGLLVSGLDWQWIFLINVPIGIACLWITHAKVVESRDPNARAIDWPGQTTLTAGLFLLVLALLRGNDDGWGSATILAELGVAAALIAAFLAIERRSDHPLLPLGLFRNRSFTGAQIAAFAISGSWFAIFLYITLYLQQVLGLSPIQSGATLIPGTVIMFVVAGATSQMAERVSARAMIVVGLALVAIGQALMVVAATDSSWTILLPGEIVALIGTGMFNPSVIAIGLGSAPPEMSGLASGVNDTFRQAGIAVGVAALGALVPAGAALGGDPQAYVDGLHTALWVSAATAGVGAIAAALLIAAPKRSERIPADLVPEGAY
ncbi:MAG: MFS transporter [Solirubrobacteraceae bacterium]